MNTKVAIFAFVAVYCVVSATANVIRKAGDDEALLDVSAPTRQRRIIREEDEELFDVSAPTRQRRMVREDEEELLNVSAPTRQKRMTGEDEEELLNVSAPTSGDRHKRVTCDLLSASVGGFQFNHSACAAHCLALGRKGGYCDKGVCNCRN